MGETDVYNSEPGQEKVSISLVRRKKGVYVLPMGSDAPHDGKRSEYEADSQADTAAHQRTHSGDAHKHTKTRENGSTRLELTSLENIRQAPKECQITRIQQQYWHMTDSFAIL